MKISNTVWFWGLQIFGWCLVITTRRIDEIIKLEYPHKYFSIFYALSYIVFGIFCTAVLRYYLKKQLSFDQYKKREILQISIAYFITSIVLSSLFFIRNPIRERYLTQIGKINTDTFLVSTLNSFLLIFFWLFFYFLIKNSRRINENRLERLQLEAHLKEAQLNTLKGQINPHFMFNSLNNIRGLMLEDVEKSREMITRLSEMLRSSLTQNDTHKIPLRDEITMVKNYIELSKIQFEKRLKFSQEIDPSLHHIEVPPMLIQMLVENAIKHGISNQKNGGVVTLNVFRSHKKIHIKVTNTGILNPSKKTTRIGLDNIKNRIQLLYSGNASFSMVQEDDHVVTTIQIPMP